MRIAVLLALVASSEPALAASFDCTKAAAPDEVAICHDSKLSALDDLVARAYAQAHKTPGVDGDPKDRANALADARACGARKAACKADVPCLMSAHVGVLEDLAADGSTVAVPGWVAATDMVAAVPPETAHRPTREGECARTRVSDIGGRLEGDLDFATGASIAFADGARQVTYDKLAGIVASRRGDPVLVCLTSLPKHCPPGDDRGRTYTVTNLRTRQSWSVGEDQHRCGGA